MTAAAALALLADLEARDVRLALEGDRLSYDAPAGGLTEADRQAVAENRAALVAILAAGSRSAMDGAAGREALLFDADSALVARLQEAALLPWLRSARAGSAPEAGLAWLDLQARDLAPDLGEEDRGALVARVLGLLCALSPSPGRELAQEAWDALEGRQEPQEAAPDLPALCLYRGPDGRPWESWAVPLPSFLSLDLKSLRPPVVAVPVPGKPWGRADVPAGRLSADLVARVLEERPAALAPPSAELLAERERLAQEPTRPDLWSKVQAGELVLLAAPLTAPEGLPEACPACRSRSPGWKPLSVPGRYLCGRCWQAVTLEDRR